MKYFIFLLLASALGACNSDYVRQTETRSVNDNGTRWQTTVTRTLRKADRRILSVRTASQTPLAASQSMDRYYYHADGRLRLIQSYQFHDGNWELVRSRHP